MSPLLFILLSCRNEQRLEPRDPIEPLVDPPTYAGPIRLIDGACVGEPPEPVCEPQHLTTPKDLVDPRACRSRADCLPNEFCGAGACRVLEGEKATFCIERGWVEGKLCDIPWMRLSADLQDGGVRTPILSSERELDLEASCQWEARLCTEVDLAAMARSELRLSIRMTDAPGDIWGHWAQTYIAGPETFRTMLEEGCMEVQGVEGEAERTHVGVFAHIGLWYP